jgi:uncharacterized membrane protein
MSVSSLKDAKVLGVVGSIMVLLTPIPTFGWVLGIAGLVLVLLAIRDISKVVGDRSIFDNMVKSVLLAIGAIAVAAVTVAGVVYRVLGIGSFVGSTFVFPSSVPVADYFGLALIVAGGLVAIWAILTVSAVFVRRSYKSMADKLNVKRFETAGKFYLIGAATSIIGVGLILVFVAEILQAISFLSITENQQTAPVMQQTPVVN